MLSTPPQLNCSPQTTVASLVANCPELLARVWFLPLEKGADEGLQQRIPLNLAHTNGKQLLPLITNGIKKDYPVTSFTVVVWF